ncbi:3-hydroxyacyl-CoA dehydrogenase NAD-binding domain-containing protein, partial [Streptomyces misionensis]|uniref:3-hydroxyacyl-CoA dehydrogenase NAD-binding domain-containing protein n=1 Tax=Streptomyces misionensis TaxID=67331 RepID=UPI0036BCCD82
MDTPLSTIAVVGLGTMGTGIAEVLSRAGHEVIGIDISAEAAARAVAALESSTARAVGRGRITEEERGDVLARFRTFDDLRAAAEAELVIEVVPESYEIKQQVFRELDEVVSPTTILATGTNALSVTRLAAESLRPERVLGLHFFNPAPLLPLVEVVRGFATDETAATRAYETMKTWGKTPVRCADTPGFIVNRIARPFYAEAFRVYEERGADPATIDAVLRECGGFRMGPFELTDLIGQDVNEAVTRSVWDSFFQDPKFTPSLAQRRLVESGRLGRKTGH